MSVYVITATKHGSTAEIGAVIAGRLAERGHEVTAADAGRCELPGPGAAVVIGSPIYMGKWLKPARELLDRLGAASFARPTYVFTVGPVGDPPKPDDAGPEQAVQDLIADHAAGSRLFAGKLDRGKLSRLERLAVKAVKAPDGDYRDWAAITAWADQIADELAAEEDPVAVGSDARR